VRDLRVRWALEEAGIPYQERLIGPEDQASAAYRALQPFGQVPAIETGNLNYSSRAPSSSTSPRVRSLMPSDPNDGADKRVDFRALNSVEPQIQNLAELDLFHAREAWAPMRRPMAVEGVQKRLGRRRKLARRPRLFGGTGSRRQI